MTNEELLRRIREERQKQGISLRDLGKLLGVSGQYISMIERGKAPLKMEDYLRICEFFDISVIKILMQEAEKEGCATLAEKIYALSERDAKILTNMIEMMQ